MFIFVFINLAFASFTYTEGQCQCQQLQVESECKFNTQCSWDTTQKLCKRKPCSELKDQCTTIQGCALDNNNNCVEFTKCSDYTATNYGQCQTKDKTCTEDQQTTNGYSCKIGTFKPTCQKFTNKTDCKGYQSDTQVCFWTLNPTTKVSECMPVTYTKCEDGQSDPNLCTLNPACKYTMEKKCVQKTCSDVTTEFFCTSIPSWDNKQLTLCQWNGSCSEAANVDVLTQTKCYSSSLKNYHWNTSSNKCTICTEKTTTPTGTSTGTTSGSTGSTTGTTSGTGTSTGTTSGTGTSTGTTTGTSTGTTTGTSTGTTGTSTGTSTGTTTGTTTGTSTGTTTGTTTGTGTSTGTTTTTGTGGPTATATGTTTTGGSATNSTKPNDAVGGTKNSQLLVLVLMILIIIQ